MRSRPYSEPYSAAQAVLTLLAVIFDRRPARRGRAYVGVARPEPAVGGQLPCCARRVAARRVRSGEHRDHPDRGAVGIEA